MEYCLLCNDSSLICTLYAAICGFYVQILPSLAKKQLQFFISNFYDLLICISLLKAAGVFGLNSY
jgi:hypothetical protein